MLKRNERRADVKKIGRDKRKWQKRAQRTTKKREEKAKKGQ
jgi:hypothetical protein